MGQGSGYIVRNSNGEKVFSVFDSKNFNTFNPIKIS